MAIPIKFVQFIFRFVILTLNCARWVPCSTGLATLASAKQVHADPHATVFLPRTKQPHTFPTICSNLFKAGSQQLLAIWMVNTRTSTLRGDTEQLFWASGPCIMCSYACAKAFNFELWLFKKCKSDIETKLKFLQICDFNHTHNLVVGALTQQRLPRLKTAHRCFRNVRAHFLGSLVNKSTENGPPNAN